MDDHVDIKVDFNQIEEDALILIKHLRPGWKKDQIITKVFTEGFSNRLIGCKQSSDTENKDMVLVRVYGENSEKFVDRKQEIQNMKLLHAAGCGNSFYCTFQNGMCYGFTPGQCLTEKNVREPNIIRLITKEMVRIQKIRPGEDIKRLAGHAADYDTKPFLFTRAWQFYNTIQQSFSTQEQNKRFQTSIGTKQRMKSELEFVEKKITGMNCPIVFSHNDIIYTNIVYNKEEDRTYFIDWEFGCCNYLPYEIANHFCEFAGMNTDYDNLYPSDEERLFWLRVYLEMKAEDEGNPQPVTAESVQELFRLVETFTPCSHLVWSLWALAQSQLSDIDFDYLGYAITRWNQYFKWKGHLEVNIEGKESNRKSN